MKVCTSVVAVRRAVRALRAKKLSVALVPTMGALHEGHVSLLALAARKADAVVVSIFVNPSQFGPNEDFSRYPRTLARDLRLCRRAGVKVVFAPPPGAMYAPDHSTWVVEESLSRGLCGEFRPGHFRGVATVVLKLFNIVLPDAAVFGRKDYQQLQVVRRLVRDLDVPVRIIAAPTVREKDGLALSSRNRYLSPAQRAAAPEIYRILHAAARGGRARPPSTVEKDVRARLLRVPGVTKIDYVVVRDAETLAAPAARSARPAVLAVALWMGRTRLIDNVDL